MVSSIWLILFFIVPTILDLLVAPTIAQDDGPCTTAAEYCWKCSDTAGSYTNGSLYQQNLNTLLTSFSSSNTTQDSGFYNYSLGDDPNKVNAIALCRGDLRLEDCRSCVSDSTQILLRNCSNHKDAILWARPCMVRYSQNLIFGVKEEDPYKYFPSKDNPSNAEAFGLVLTPLLEFLSDKAALGHFREKFAAGHATVPGGETIYALVQCTPDINKENCSNCLKNSISAIPGDQGVLMQGAKILKPSCNIRYQVNMFYESAADSLVNVSAPVTPATLAPVTLSKKILVYNSKPPNHTESCDRALSNRVCYNNNPTPAPVNPPSLAPAPVNPPSSAPAPVNPPSPSPLPPKKDRYPGM